jgi:enterochelin esterase-like enzyme
VYVLHGLPADGTGYLNTTWLPPVLDLLPREAIAVFPQGSTATDSDPEYHDWGPTRDWETALARELPAYVDAHYRTIASRSGRALVGYSAGGYGAMVIGLHHLDEYGAIESWSGYFHATTPDGTASMELGSPSADAYANLHTLVPRLRAELARRPTFLGFYIGASDPLFVPENRQFDAELRRARVRHVFEVYAGGHDPTLWTAHAAAWLAMALRRLR